MTPSNLTLAERERLAYISGEVQLAQVLGELSDAQDELDGVDERLDEAREDGREAGRESVIEDIRKALDRL